MIGRNGARVAVADAAEGLKRYGGDVVADEKLRERLLAALAAGVGAQRRATRQTGVTGTVRRLAGDPVLRAQLTQMLLQLQKARQRVERRRSHKLRNSVLVLAGFGAASAAVAVPAVRDRILGVVGDVRQKVGAAGSASAPTTVTEEIVVEAPLATTYNQWTQFEEFPQFMEGVEQVEQIDDTRLRWVAKVSGKRAEWEAKVLFQEPDSRIGWQSTDGKETSGTVSFEPDGESRTRIKLAMTYVPEGVLEQAGSAIGLDRRRIRGDLERFKELIEQRGSETGAWRGEIEGGRAKAASSSSKS
jgi:uncharacterized membrane protein